MKEAKENPTGHYRLFQLPILLVSCLVLLAGATMARYQLSESRNVRYAAKDYAAVRLWRDYDEEAGILTEGQNAWRTEDEQKTLRFYASNGTSADYAADDQRVHIRLLATAGIRDGEDLRISLDVFDPSGSYQGTVQPVLEKTPLYETFGPGWLITFQDDEGKELSWKLEGGCLSVLSAELTAWNMELEDTEFLQLQVMSAA